MWGCSAQTEPCSPGSPLGGLPGIVALTAFGCGLCLETVLPVSSLSLGKVLRSGHCAIYLSGLAKAGAPLGPREVARIAAPRPGAGAVILEPVTLGALTRFKAVTWSRIISQ